MSTESNSPTNFGSIDIVHDSVDALVLAGIQTIKSQGMRSESRGLAGMQAYNVNYWLINPLNRVHTLRAPNSVRYFARELLAYCEGSLKVDGLARASKVWHDFADDKGYIYSNYGHYVFHQKTPQNISQYAWAAETLRKDINSRRCVIIIDSITAKLQDSKDIPCTLGMHFFVLRDRLCMSVTMRSTDIMTGLPYDIGFFSFILELLLEDLRKTYPHLSLGYCVVKSNLTQLYDSRLQMSETARNGYADFTIRMPKITDPEVVLEDIYNHTFNSDIMGWALRHSDYEA